MLLTRATGLNSRSSSFGRSPYVPEDPQQLPAPEAFSRPINAANSFSPFDPLKVLDMDEVYDTHWKLPKMPSLLSTHDVRPDDWKRCMQVFLIPWLTLTHLLILLVPGFGSVLDWTITGGNRTWW
jgi:hypothetical protein